MSIGAVVAERGLCVKRAGTWKDREDWKTREGTVTMKDPVEALCVLRVGPYLSGLRECRYPIWRVFSTPCSSAGKDQREVHGSLDQR
jgi:hypothetical protein